MLVKDIPHQTWHVDVQVELAQSEYQLPRLTRMWTHLERQAGGRVRGMGEKQIEVDKRILRTRMGQLRRSLEDVCTHRKQYRQRRAEVSFCTHPLPEAGSAVVSTPIQLDARTASPLAQRAFPPALGQDRRHCLQCQSILPVSYTYSTANPSRYCTLPFILIGNEQL